MSGSFDLAILGGGCSGLSLAQSLIDCGYSKNVVIIEPRAAYEHDRTWCFWAEKRHNLSSIVSKSWSKWQISMAGRVVEHMGHRLSYQQIRSADFYAAALKAMARAPNIEMRKETHAGAITGTRGDVKIETDSGHISARLVIDTRPRPPERDTAKLWQVFSGGDVETRHACFDPSQAGLMQNMSSGAAGLKFLYVLPTTPHRALVQTTRFALNKSVPKALDWEFERDLAALIDGPVRIHRRERGCLPMGQTPQKPQAIIIGAGQAAGALRASSGYGFMRIQSWAHEAACQIASGRAPTSKPPGSFFERQMDSIFLTALARSPEAAADWFARLAMQLNGDEFGRFMSETASMRLWLKVVSALPKTPFLHALIAGAAPMDATALKAVR